MTGVAKTEQNVKFNVTDFNNKFEENDKKNSTNNQYLDQTSEYDIYSVKRNYGILYNFEKQSFSNETKPVDIMFGLKDLIYILFDFFNNKKNPLPFIFSTEHTQFLFAILLIVTGTILLLFSNILR
jgi:hypothetical protein